MKRVYVCIAIILAMIAASTISLIMLKKSNDILFEQIDSIIIDHSSGKDVSKQVDELEKYWRSYYIKFSFIAQSSTLDDISYSVAKLEPLLKDDSDEFISECRSIRYWAYLVYDSQFPTLHSVF